MSRSAINLIRLPIESLRRAPTAGLRVTATPIISKPLGSHAARNFTTYRALFRPVNAPPPATGGSGPGNAELRKELVEVLRELRTTNTNVKELPGELRADLRQLETDMSRNIDRLNVDLNVFKEEHDKSTKSLQGVIGLFGAGLLFTVWILLREFKLVQTNLLILGRMEEKNNESLRLLASRNLGENDTRG